jgi:hypothetical protein
MLMQHSAPEAITLGGEKMKKPKTETCVCGHSKEEHDQKGKPWCFHNWDEGFSDGCTCKRYTPKGAGNAGEAKGSVIKIGSLARAGKTHGSLPQAGCHDASQRLKSPEPANSPAPDTPMCIHTNCREEATKNYCSNHFGQMTHIDEEKLADEIARRLRKKFCEGAKWIGGKYEIIHCAQTKDMRESAELLEAKEAIEYAKRK